MGPGLLESVYHTCMLYELRRRPLEVVSRQFVPIRYKDLILDGGFRLDLLVGNDVVVELKAVEAVLPVHRSQLLSYLRLLQKPLGLLINFNVPVLVDGVARIMNGCEEAALRSRQSTSESTR